MVNIYNIMLWLHATKGLRLRFHLLKVPNRRAASLRLTCGRQWDAAPWGRGSRDLSCVTVDPVPDSGRAGAEGVTVYHCLPLPSTNWRRWLRISGRLGAWDLRAFPSWNRCSETKSAKSTSSCQHFVWIALQNWLVSLVSERCVAVIFR